MTRLQSSFTKPHPALVTFITGGDGDTAANLDALVEGGADIIELGMPFTDPMADGPAIQAANIRSLDAGTTTADIFTIATAFRTRHHSADREQTPSGNVVANRRSCRACGTCRKRSGVRENEANADGRFFTERAKHRGALLQGSKPAERPGTPC